MKYRIPIVVAVGVALFFFFGYLYYFISHSWLSHALINGSTITELYESDALNLKPNLGFITPLPITNLRTSPAPGDIEVASVIHPRGKISYYAPSMGGSIPEEYELFERRVTNIFGSDIISYSVGCHFRRFEGHLWCNLIVTGGGSAGYTSKFTGAFEDNDILRIDISENIFGDELSYSIKYSFSDSRLYIVQ